MNFLRLQPGQVFSASMCTVTPVHAVWVTLSWAGLTPKLDVPPSQSSFLKPEGWGQYFPKTDVDCEVILDGVSNRFHIVDSLDFPSAEVDNYSLATAGRN